MVFPVLHFLNPNPPILIRQSFIPHPKIYNKRSIASVVFGLYYEVMTDGIERDLGPQPIAAILAKNSLKPHDLVAASTQQITHKMVSRACKGRRLTLNTQTKVLNALNAATGKKFSLGDLFNY
jgi:hypothetical protein